MIKKVWAVRAEYINRSDDEPESNVVLRQFYKTREDAHKVYAHGERKCAEAGITDLRWSLEALYIEERVEFGIYMADKIIDEELEREQE